MPYAEIAVFVVLIGSLVANWKQSRTIGKERERNGILEKGLKQAKLKLAKANLAPVTDADEQSDSL